MKKSLTGVMIAALMAAGNATADTLADVINKGFVQCGVSQGLPGFSSPDANADCQGIDVEV